ncbi:unannotated protein [freshwater metagenome]|uniref:Unannotated protein n=1 Tax=freshwater metagenome TaxID=449393 RepID=A0A6J7FUQ8_9ZZZZ|nr:hypothetical protein [Actinomycetota bacterium]
MSVARIAPERLAGPLDDSRQDLRHRLLGLLTAGERLIGIHGAPQVGKSAIVARVLGEYETRNQAAVIRIDLDGAYEPEVVHWQWARGLARAIVGPVNMTHFLELDQDFWPASSRSDRVLLQRTLGPLADVALSPDPAPGGSETTRDLARATEELARTRRTVVLVEHLEAPQLTPRHPVDVDQLLWDLRATMQRTDDLQIVLVARSAVVDDVTGPDAAFVGDGTWVEVRSPPPSAWREIAALLGIDGAAFVEEAIALTRGDVRAMQQLLAVSDATSARARFDEAASRADLLAARYLEHARSVHRYGAQLLIALSRGVPPRSERAGAMTPREVNRALPKLATAGLIFRKDTRAWSVSDPVVAHYLANRNRISGPR